MEKYHPIIESINKGLNEFSNYLKPEYKIPIIDKTSLTEVNSCNLLEKSWREFRFPKSHRHGVYFIFGRKKSDDSFLGVYVGKASHNSYMCRRLSTHLNNSQKQDKIYLKKDYHHVEFLLEFVLTIPMELIFMAPALEEFLIYNLQKQGVKMINSIGNTQLEDIGFIWT